MELRNAVAIAALAAVAVGIAIACGGDASRPVSSPGQSTTVPVQSPATTASRTPTLAPVATTVRGHPPETRTGIRDLDAVLDALLSRDPAWIRALFVLTPSPCVEDPQGVTNPPKCPPGVPAGSLIDIFRASAGEAVWPEDLDRVLAAWAGPPHRLYAVYRNPGEPGDWLPPADYAVVLVLDIPNVDFDVFGWSEFHMAAGRIVGARFNVSLRNRVGSVARERFLVPPPP